MGNSYDQKDGGYIEMGALELGGIKASDMTLLLGHFMS